MRSGRTTGIGLEEGVEKLLAERGGANSFITKVGRDLVFEIFPYRLLVSVVLAQKRKEILLCFLNRSPLP